jgi:hypothetical protein
MGLCCDAFARGWNRVSRCDIGAAVVKGGVEKAGVCGAATSLQRKAEQTQPLHISSDVVLDCTQGVNLKQSRIRDIFMAISW